MNPLNLSRDPLGATIRARPAETSSIVWVHRPKRGVWCVLRCATGGRNIYLCCDWSPGNEPVHILTSAPDDGDPRRPRNACPACCTELAAGTTAAVAVDDLDDAPTPVASRTLPPLSATVEVWDSWHGDPPRDPDDDCAFDHLDDLRPEEP